MAERAPYRSSHVDTVNEEKIVESAIKSMLGDPRPSLRLPNAEETRELTRPLAGTFSGIGITFNMNNDTSTVLADRAGGLGTRRTPLRRPHHRGKRHVDSRRKKKKQRDHEAAARPQGTDVDVRVLRAGASADTIDFRITRDDIPIHSVDAAYIDGKTGYIRLNKFAAEGPQGE